MVAIAPGVDGPAGFESASESANESGSGPASEPANGRAKAKRTGRPHLGRSLVLLVAGIYFLGPMLAAFWFSIYNSKTGLGFHAYTGFFKAAGFATAFRISAELALITVLLTLALLLPTMVLVHLRYPRLRPVVELLSLLPLVIPPVALVVGVRSVLGWGGEDRFAGTIVATVLSTDLQSTSLPLILAFEYVVLALPFTYRALDAGLRSVAVVTLVEASRNLGAGWPTVLLRVVLPTLRTAVLNAALLAFALVLGEYTMAKILLFPTYTVWLQGFGSSDGQLQVGLSLISLAGTWLLLIVIAALAGRTRSAKPSRGKAT